MQDFIAHLACEIESTIGAPTQVHARYSCWICKRRDTLNSSFEKQKNIFDKL
jgi:hypothetical protein